MKQTPAATLIQCFVRRFLLSTAPLVETYCTYEISKLFYLHLNFNRFIVNNKVQHLVNSFLNSKYLPGEISSFGRWIDDRIKGQLDGLVVLYFRGIQNLLHELPVGKPMHKPGLWICIILRIWILLFVRSGGKHLYKLKNYLWTKLKVEQFYFF